MYCSVCEENRIHVIAELPKDFWIYYTFGLRRGDILRCDSCGILVYSWNLATVKIDGKTAYQHEHCGPVVFEQIIGDPDDDGSGFLGSDTAALAERLRREDEGESFIPVE